MKILQFEDKHITEVVTLWNKSCKDEMPYKPFTEEGFRKKFIENPNFSYEGTFVGIESDKVIGFANGICQREFLPGETPGNTPGYLTFVLIDKSCRNKGYGTALLKAVENYFIRNDKSQIQVASLNPIKLEWYIPGTDKHDHNNAQGVDVDGNGYGFLQKNGFVEYNRNITYYLNLSHFTLSEKILAKIEDLKQKGIWVGNYNKTKHYGFDELCDDLKSEEWRKGIKDNLALAKPYPIIIASHKGKICGFTGPVKVQESGRGWFIGIATHSAYRRLGIMTVLFNLLLDSFKKAGAKFSTLFTGIKNPARKVYEQTGCVAVKTWAAMKKEI